MASSITPTPDGFRKALWDRVMGQWALRDDELQIMIEAARTVDALEAFQAVLHAEGPIKSGKVHPALPDLRAQRIAFGRLLGQLGLEGEDGTVLPPPTQARARKAAETRWAQHRARGA